MTGPTLGTRLQPLHAFVRPRDGRDPLVRVRELLIDLAHDGEQGGELREQPARQRQGEDAADEALGTAGRHAPAVLPEQGADHTDVPRAGADQGVAHRQAPAHMALGIGEPMGGAVGPQPAGLGQRPGVAPIGLDLATAGRVHRREVRVGDDDLVAQPFQTARHPLALGRGLEEDAGPRPVPQDGGEPLGGRCGSRRSISSPSAPRMQIWLSFLCTSMPIWSMAGPPLLAALTAVHSVGQRMPPRRVGVSHFIRSTFRGF